MVLDILSERGYHAVYQEQRTPVPERLDPQTGTIACRDRIEHRFEIRFHPPEIRRGQ
jgi:adenylate kinase